MTLSISGGRIQIEDGVKKNEEYAPPRKALIEYRFEVPAGEDGQKFADAALAGVETMLRRALLLTAAPAAVAPATVEGKAPAAPKTTRAKATDKDKLAAAAGLPTEGLDEGEATKPAGDDLGDLLGETAPAPVTDAELGKAAQEKNAKLKADKGDKHDPTAIRKLITEYAGEGKRINDIPAAKRHEFITKLNALK